MAKTRAVKGKSRPPQGGLVASPRLERAAVLAQMTDMQKIFARALVLNGGNGAAAAREAGYAHPDVEAHRLRRLPSVISYVRVEQRALIAGDMANVALGVVRAIMLDGDARAADRLSAARLTLEAARLTGREQGQAIEEDDNRALSELSSEELDAKLSKLLDLDAVEVPDQGPIDGQAVEIAPDVAPGESAAQAESAANPGASEEESAA